MLLNLLVLFILNSLNLIKLSSSHPHNHEENEGKDGMAGMSMSDMPPEHTNFGKCNIRPGRNPSYAPPTKGFTMIVENDFPNGDLEYSPRCDNKTYPEAFLDGRIARFPYENLVNVENEKPQFYSENVKSESTKSMGVKSFHISNEEKANYNNPIPAAGPHRAMWAAYGTYLWCPPGRWLHNLEHGAIVFMYHPCIAEKAKQDLVSLARNCLWKHVITSWDKGLSIDYPIALVTWGKVLHISNFEEESTRQEALNFIQKNAKAGSSGEGMCWGNGGFVTNIIKHAEIVTSVEDDEICPEGFVRPEMVTDYESISGSIDEEIEDIDEAVQEKENVKEITEEEAKNVLKSKNVKSDQADKSEETVKEVNPTAGAITADRPEKLEIDKEAARSATIAILFIICLLLYVAFRLGFRCYRKQSSSISNHENKNYYAENLRNNPHKVTTNSKSFGSSGSIVMTIGNLLDRVRNRNVNLERGENRAEYVSLMNMDDDGSDEEFSSIPLR